MKYWIVIFALLLVSCSVAQNQLPNSTETPIPNTSTPHIIEVTQIVRVERTVVVTATPEPLLAQECFNDAISQFDLNGCTALERDLAKDELEKIISKIHLPSEQKSDFDELQTEWETRAWDECSFFYGRIVEDENGNIYYAGGSMAPMQVGMCMANKYKDRARELYYAYLNY